MSDIAVIFRNVTKKYNKSGKYQPSLREWIAAITKEETFNKSTFKALDKMSFTIEKGKVVGFIGPNGAGKSTILKLLARITYPTSGEIEINGKVAGLLELGTGFHPELTGAENIELYGSIVGLSRKKIKSIFNQIVKFSGLEKFMDTPVRHYSSGMVARLGFSVAIHVEADILIVDEVLAVGDQAFQKKCMDYMINYCKDPKHTVIFVSHNLENVKQICEEVYWIDSGKIVANGSVNTIIKQYVSKQ